ncbi:MAG: SDR family oxidoreductase [Pseudomonadota bacterium]
MPHPKLALVTGAARGIGRAAAEALIDDGWTMVLADIDAAALADTARDLGAALTFALDVADTAALTAMFDQVEAKLGPVGALVNNAGIAMPGDFLTYRVEDFDRVIAVNLTAPFVATQRAARTMVAEGIAGAVVNISSINAQVAIPAIPAYCASKGGIGQLTKTAALALAGHKIRVNAVGPGSIDTDMLAGLNTDPAAKARVLSRTPLGRIGTAREIGDVVAFLCSDKASYITGETIFADGGRLGLNYTV